MTGERSILILSPWASIFSMSGGGTPSAFRLLQGLLDSGYAVDFAAPREENGETWFPDDDRLRVHRYGSARPPLHGYVGRWLTWLERTVRLTVRGTTLALRKGRPDVVLAFSAATVPAAVCIGALLRRPTVGVLFGTFLHPAVERRRGLIGNFEEAIAFKCPVDRLIVNNDGTRGDEVARALGVPEQRLRFWMNGVDLDACAAAAAAPDREESGITQDRPLVVSASRLVGWKRVDRILRAAPQVLAERPDALFAITGDGPERAALEKLAVELSIEHAVRFLGPLSREQNLRLIASADVFCALYDFSCVGVALLEALGCGVAAVVADTGATRDFVEDGANGLVVAPDDIPATAKAIARLLDDAGLRARLGREARRRAEERFLRPHERATLELQTIAEVVGSGGGAG